MREVWEQHFGVSQRSTGQHGVSALLHDLKFSECPAPTASVPLRQVRLRVHQELSAASSRRGQLTWSPFLVEPQVQLYSSLHLTRAVLSWLLEEDGQLMKELWKAVAWFTDVDRFSISAEICRLLFPEGAPGP